jgi:hypothetical protein
MRNMVPARTLASLVSATVVVAAVGASQGRSASSAVTVPTTVTGTVTVNGAPFTGGTIAYGSTVDVTHGSVTMQTTVGTLRAAGPGRATAAFVLLRTTVEGKPYVELRLAKGDFGVCPKRTTADASGAAASAIVVRGLWGNGKGNFQTRGRFAAATVRGTHWLTDDRCDGTWTKVVTGVVQISDFVNHTTVTVRAGHTFLAKA